MSWEIIVQPNSKYCIYSSVVDHFVYVDLESNDLYELYRRKWGESGVSTVDRVLTAFSKGEKPYHQFTQSFDEAVKWIKELHGSFDFICGATTYTEDHFLVE